MQRWWGEGEEERSDGGRLGHSPLTLSGLVAGAAAVFSDYHLSVYAR